MLKAWHEERFREMPPVSQEHLGLFKRALACNVQRGWNLKKGPYIPTGSSTLEHTRSEGGSWRRSKFSPWCRTELVYSSGKPRIVTLYSSYNSEVLSPLHHALYATLQREGWLLVGSPTDEDVRGLNGDGAYVSVDYRAATDNIRSEYCQAAVQVLIDKGEGLTADEVRCLRVVGELRFSNGAGADNFDPACWAESPPARRGQPMGSLMSFPLLCLINKTVVDLSLVDAVHKGKATWKEFRAHRCLINGDDLLYRELDSSRGILDGILFHGGAVGLVVNEEKTMVCPDWAEVNSTAFYRGTKQKKTNVGVLELSRDVSDPVGFLADSLRTTSSFRRMARKWVTPIRQAERKVQGPIPPMFFTVLLRDRYIGQALRWQPARRRQPPNPFPVVTKPAGYDLTRGEEVCYISERVARLMDGGYKPEKPVRCSTPSGAVASIQSQLRKKKPTVEDNILKVLADGWQQKTKEKLWLEDDAAPGLTTWAWDERSKIEVLLDAIHAFKQRKRLGCASPDAGPQCPGGGVPPRVDVFARGDDFVGFDGI